MIPLDPVLLYGSSLPPGDPIITIGGTSVASDDAASTQIDPVLVYGTGVSAAEFEQGS